jgi:hypothetical protein
MMADDRPRGGVPAWVTARTPGRLALWLAGTAVVGLGAAATIGAVWAGGTVPRWALTGYLALLVVFCAEECWQLAAERRRARVVARIRAGVQGYVRDHPPGDGR